MARMMPHCLKQYGMESIATPMMELANVMIDLSDIFNSLGITFPSVRVSLKRLHVPSENRHLLQFTEQVEINDYYDKVQYLMI